MKASSLLRVLPRARFHLNPGSMRTNSSMATHMPLLPTPLDANAALAPSFTVASSRPLPLALRSSAPLRTLHRDWFDYGVYDPKERREEMARNPESSTARLQRYIRYIVGGLITLVVFQGVTYAYVRVSAMLSAKKSSTDAGATAIDESAGEAPFGTGSLSAGSAAATTRSAVSTPARAPTTAPAEIRRVIVPRFSLRTPYEPIYVVPRGNGSEATSDGGM